MRTKHRNRKDKWFLIRYGQSQHTFSFKTKHQAKMILREMSRGQNVCGNIIHVLAGSYYFPEDN